MFNSQCVQEIDTASIIRPMSILIIWKVQECALVQNGNFHHRDYQEVHRHNCRGNSSVNKTKISDEKKIRP